jgi:O-antigen/teichoic acid export membrane protein
MPSSVLQKNVLYAIGGAGNSLALTLLVPYLVQSLTRGQFGAWALSEVVIVLLSTVIVLGLDVGLMKEYWYAKEAEERRRLTGTVLLAQVFWSAIVFVLGFSIITRPWVSQRLAGTIEMTNAVRWGGMVLAISVFEGAFALLLTVFRIRERAAMFVGLSIGRVVMVVGFAIAGVRVIEGVNGALMGRMLGVMIAVGVAGFVSRREIALVMDWSLLRRALGYGLPLLPTGLAGYVLFASDRYFLQSLRGLETVAVYTFAYKVASLVDLMVTRPFALDWAPRRFKIASEPGAEKRYVSALIGYLFCATAFGSAVIVGTPYVYGLLAPQSYWEGSRIVPVIVASYIIYGLSYPLNVGIMLRDRTVLLPLIGGVAAAACIVLNVLLIPTHGMAGAAWATLGSYLIWTAMIAGVSLKHYPIKYPMGAMVTIMVGGVFASLGPTAVGRFAFQEGTVMSVLVSGVWVCVIFCLIAYLLWGRSLRFAAVTGRTDVGPGLRP